MNQNSSNQPGGESPQDEDTVEVSDEAMAAAESATVEDADSAIEEGMDTQTGDPGEDDPDSVASDPGAPNPGAKESAATDGPSPEQELGETKDKLLRTLAEMENLRRRTQKEREDTAKYAISNFARDVLTVADNLNRALTSIPEEVLATDETVKGIVEGLAMVERELVSAFDRAGLKRIEAMGEKFNHEYHEAMFEVPTADSPPGTVVQVMEIGYTLHDRLLRPARVGVAKSHSGEAPPREGVDTTA